MISIELGDIYLTIANNVFKKLQTYVQDHIDKPESGGILIGYYIDNYSFFISDISTPSDDDVAARYSFVRTFRKAQKVIAHYFNLSKNKKIYLGEWHTHPEEVPTPSCIDQISFEKQLKVNQLNSKIIFMLIIGTAGIYVASYDVMGIRVYRKILNSNLV